MKVSSKLKKDGFRPGASQMALTFFYLLLLFVLNLTGIGGCSQEGPGTLVSGDYQQTITIDGIVRTYILHVPSGYDGSQALPLVFVLHGGGGSAESMVRSTGLNAKADQENFFVAYLNGTVGTGGSGWNTGITPGNGITVDDVAFVRNLVAQLESTLPADPGRIYAAGFSNGGMMCHRLAAELPDLLASVAMVAGTIGASPDGGATFYMIPEAQGPISVIMLHGEQDPTVLYYGGQGGGQVFAKPVADAVAFWTQADACTGTPQMETSADGLTLTEDHTACSAGTEVELISMKNGGHQWPTLENQAAFSGTDAVWEFFSRHSKAD